jgi:hypothetical protein
MTFYTFVVLLILVGYFWWLARLVHEFFTNPRERARLVARPERMFFTLLGVVLFTMFLVGICIPSIGEITIISIGSQNFRIWGVGLLGSFAWLAFAWRTMNRSD